MLRVLCKLRTFAQPNLNVQRYGNNKSNSKNYKEERNS